MNKKYLVGYLVLSCLFISATFGQEKSFEILGKVKGKHIRKIEILYVPIGSDFIVDKKIVFVKNKRFSFKGSLAYPYAVYFRYNDSVRSKLFFLDSGVQHITVRAMKGKPLVNNIHDLEYSKYLQKKQNAYEKNINKVINTFNITKTNNGGSQDSISNTFNQKLNTINEEKHYILKEYLNNNSSSFVALWLLFFELRKNIYIANIAEPFQNDNFTHSEIGLLQKIKETITGKMNISPGNKIPLLTFYDKERRGFNFFELNSEKYLLEFWFSNCGPCIKQFPDLKRIAQQYDTSYFSIIGISTDADINLWKKTVLNYELPWVNLIDLDKNVNNVFKIFSFPTNILINRYGEVLKVNIDLIELEKLLKEDFRND